MAESDKDSMIEFVRDILRDVMKDARKRSRHRALNKNRFILGEKIECGTYDLEFVSAAAKSLKKKSLNTNEYKKLQNALIQSEEHINTFLKVDHAMNGLIRDLSSRSAQSKIMAANCCCNLALGNSKARLSLAKAAAPYLVAELESTSEPLMEVCVWTIGNLISENRKAFAIFEAQDLVKCLVHLAKNCSDSSLPFVSYTIVNCINVGGDGISSDDLRDVAAVYVNRLSENADSDTLWVLALLSSQPECLDTFLGIIEKIYELFVDIVLNKKERVEKLSALLRILGNIINEQSGTVGALFLQNGEDGKNIKLFDELLSHQFIHVRKETLWLIGNLYNHQVLNIDRSSILICSPNSLQLAIRSVREEIV